MNLQTIFNIDTKELFRHMRKLAIVIFGAFTNALAINFFLIPANIFSSGFTGISQLSAYLFSRIDITVSTGVILLLLNIPVAILAWRKVGKSFTVYSFISVAFMSYFLVVLPIQSLSEDSLLNAVFGGVIASVGTGLTLKFGASSGGMDIIALVLSKLSDRSVGTYVFLLNAGIILSAGLIFEWEKALYTLVTLYVSTRVIDTIHTRHEKLTVMIVTSKSNEMRDAIHAKLVRGITILPATGAFTNESKSMLMMVITRYELYDLYQVIRQIDAGAFTNVVQTTNVFGRFRKE